VGTSWSVDSWFSSFSGSHALRGNPVKDALASYLQQAPTYIKYNFNRISKAKFIYGTLTGNNLPLLKYLIEIEICKGWYLTMAGDLCC